jgi:hypothetical protein
MHSGRMDAGRLHMPRLTLFCSGPSALSPLIVSRASPVVCDPGFQPGRQMDKHARDSACFRPMAGVQRAAEPCCFLLRRGWPCAVVGLVSSGYRVLESAYGDDGRSLWCAERRRMAALFPSKPPASHRP